MEGFSSLSAPEGQTLFPVLSAVVSWSIVEHGGWPLPIGKELGNNDQGLHFKLKLSTCVHPL
jgi:hypothetical protein